MMDLIPGGMTRTCVPVAAALAFALLGLGPDVQALEPPRLEGRVMDLASLLDAGSVSRVEAGLKAYEDETGHQFAVLIIPSLEGDPLEDFSIRVVEAWKLGSEKADNGLLLLVSTGDRKMRIEVGHGLEGVIPDVLAARVIREVITPAFKAKAFARGIEDALGLLMQAGRGEVVGASAEAVRPAAGESRCGRRRTGL